MSAVARILGTAASIRSPRLCLAWPPALGICAVLLAACGSPAPVANEVAPVPGPAPPTAQICGIERSTLASAAKAPRPKPSTPPGVYRYRTAGTAHVPGEAVRAGNLPRITDLVAAPSRRFGKLACFRLQNRLAPDLTDTGTYVIRGDELFLVGLRMQALGQVQEVRPDPAIYLSGITGSKWWGKFKGKTSGSYRAISLGERVYRVRRQPLKVVGVRAWMSYRGAVSGKRVMTVWVSTKRRLVVSEKVVARESFGVSDLHLRLRRRLIDLEPIAPVGRPGDDDDEPPAQPPPS